MVLKFGRMALAAAILAGAGLSAGSALAQGKGTVAQNCREDITKFCAGVQPGGGRLRPCIKEHHSKFSAACQAALRDAAANSATKKSSQ